MGKFGISSFLNSFRGGSPFRILLKFSGFTPRAVLKRISIFKIFFILENAKWRILPPLGFFLEFHDRSGLYWIYPEKFSCRFQMSGSAYGLSLQNSIGASDPTKPQNALIIMQFIAFNMHNGPTSGISPPPSFPSLYLPYPDKSVTNMKRLYHRFVLSSVKIWKTFLRRIADIKILTNSIR